MFLLLLKMSEAQVDHFMAQYFYKAFGRESIGEIGCDTLINQLGFLGVYFDEI